MRAPHRLAAGVLLAAMAGGHACSQPPHGEGTSTDLIAGGRMMSEDVGFRLYTSNPTPPNGLIWPGPYVESARRRIPVGRIGPDMDGEYYRCRFAYTNWYQGPGHALQTTANGSTGDRLLNVASVEAVMPGDTVAGPGVPPGAQVESVYSARAVWLTKPLAASLTHAPVTIASRPASYGYNAGELVDTGGPITVAAGVRPTFGDLARPPLPLLFGGQARAVIPPGQTVWSDWAWFTARPGGALEVDTTAYWPAKAYLFGGHVARGDLGEDNALYPATRDLVGSAADPSRQAEPHWQDVHTRSTYGPADMICSTRSPAADGRRLVIVGDSNSTGTDDMRTYDTGFKVYMDRGDAQGYQGPWERAAEALHLAHLTIGQPGKRLVDLVTSSDRLASVIGDGPAYVVLELGVNDFGGGASAASIETAWTQAVKRLQHGGFKVIAATVGPEARTRDGGRTTGGQTPLPGFEAGGAAQAFNDWLRSTGAPTYTGGRLVDMADIVMSAHDSQAFRTDIAPFADWYGYVTGMSWTLGLGGADGPHDLVAEGGGCAVEPRVRVNIVGGSIDTVVLTHAGVNCTGAPTVPLAGIPGFRAGELTLRVIPLQIGIHYHSGYDYTGAVFADRGARVSGGRLVDAHGFIAKAIQGQLQAAMAR